MRWLCVLVLLCGCSPMVDYSGDKSVEEKRFVVTSMGILIGGDAILIRDTRSGEEFIAIAHTGIARLERKRDESTPR